MKISMRIWSFNGDLLRFHGLSWDLKLFRIDFDDHDGILGLPGFETNPECLSCLALMSIQHDPTTQENCLFSF